MPVDLNKIAEKLKKQRGIGVTRDGRLTDNNPENDGSGNTQDSENVTTLKPQRFFSN